MCRSPNLSKTPLFENPIALGHNLGNTLVQADTLVQDFLGYVTDHLQKFTGSGRIGRIDRAGILGCETDVIENLLVDCIDLCGHMFAYIVGNRNSAFTHQHIVDGDVIEEVVEELCGCFGILGRGGNGEEHRRLEEGSLCLGVLDVGQQSQLERALCGSLG